MEYNDEFLLSNRFVIIRKAFPIGIDEYKEELADYQYVDVMLVSTFMKSWYFLHQENIETIQYFDKNNILKEKKIRRKKGQFLISQIFDKMYRAICDGANMKIGDIVKFTNVNNGDVSLE